MPKDNNLVKKEDLRERFESLVKERDFQLY